MLKKRCYNDNHGRAVVTVRFCSHCGEVLNDRIRAYLCAAKDHAAMRRSQSVYCVDCGERLLVGR